MEQGQELLGRVRIRPLESLDEFNATLDLQRRVWGFDDSDIVAPRFFRVFSAIGGSCLGVFLDGAMVGFTLAFAAFKSDGRPYWHSHMAAVHPDLHHQGIGYRLKLKQREEALAAGLDLIEWTFDPLQARNAYFNIQKLRVDVETYRPNFYGVTSSTLHGALPTDRLVAAWHLRSPKVMAGPAGRGDTPVPGAVQIEIPAKISAVGRDRAAAIQARVRRKFQAAFRRKLRVTHFERTAHGGFYHLSD